MDYVDFILFPLYSFAFYLIIRYRLKSFTNPIIKIYYKRSFFFRLFSCLAFSIFLVYISPGDSFSTYYAEALNVYKQTLNDPSIIDRMIFTPARNIDPSLFLKESGGSVIFFDENNYSVVRIASLFMFFSFGKYLITNLFFSMLSFEGCWRLFKFFYDQYPTLHKQFAYAILYFPTFIFWSSGIGKESLCVAGIGFITYGLYSIFIKNENLLKNILLVLVFTLLLLNVKIYILICYLPFLIYYISVSAIQKSKHKLVKYFLGPIILFVLLVGLISIILSSDDKLGLYAVDSLTENVQRQQTNFQLQSDIAESNFDLGVDFDGSFMGFVKIIPASVTATLFRPFIWEVKKVSTFLSAIESIVLIILTLYTVIKVGFLNFIATIFKSQIVCYSLFFALTFSAFIGATTLNFGSLVRYKIPCLPFYVVAMVLILHIAKKSK